MIVPFIFWGAAGLVLISLITLNIIEKVEEKKHKKRG